MSVIVMKFGGTSIANVERIKSVAQKIAREVNLGNQVAVVVSAMAGVTNQLIGWVFDSVNHHPDVFEYDVVVSTGEQITSGLLALILQSMQIPARSWLAWQLPILTDDVHAKAQQITISPEAILKSMSQGKVSVVAGFQGVDSNQRITTLGRGGSDTTAVALAHAIGADRCDIYTDVEGVFTADPRIVQCAYRLEKIAYREMLELAWQGAKVLQPFSVELAMQHKVKVRVLSSFSEGTGTWVVDEKEIEAYPPVTGIASNCDTAKITLAGISRHLDPEKQLTQILKKAHINVDMMTECLCEEDNEIDLSFTTSREDRDRLEVLLMHHKKELGFSKIMADIKVAKVAVVGIGVKDYPGIKEKMLRLLESRGITPQKISQSSIKVSALIAEERADEALSLLHSAFGLDHHLNDALKMA